MANQDDTYDLSENFDWVETTVTQHRNIDNNIPLHLIGNVKATAAKMEVVRKVLRNSPILITSWYRSPKLNAAIGGAKYSDHMKGNAVDFYCPKFGSPVLICKELVKYKKDLEFKQLIYEHTWVHISWDTIPHTLPKLEVLTLLNDGNYAAGITDKFGNSLT